MRSLSRWDYGFPGSKLRSTLSLGILDAAILSVPVCGKDVEVMERFTYRGSDIHVSTGCESEANRCLGQAWGVMDLLYRGVWHCQYLCRVTKVRVFRFFVLPVLL